MTNRLGRLALGAVPAAFLGVFFGYPVVSLLVRGLSELRSPSVLGDSTSVIWFTVWQAAASTVVTFVLGMPLAAIVARRRFRGRTVLRALVTVPFVLPTVVVASAFVATMQRFDIEDGAIGLRHSVWVILAAHAFFNIAVVVRTVGGFWSQLSDEQEQAARVLGASPMRVWTEVTLPRLRPAMLAAASIILLFSFTSFATVLILGGPRRATIETEIFRYAVSRTDFGGAALLSLVQLVAVVALVLASNRLTRNATTQAVVVDATQPFRSLSERVRAIAVATPGLALLAVPLLVMVERSLSFDGRLSLEHYRALAERPALLPRTPMDALVNSLLFAIVATVLAVTVGLCCALFIAGRESRSAAVFETLVMVPLGVSAVTVGFGMLLALDTGVLDLRTSWWIVPIAQSLIGTPFVVRAVLPVLRAIDPAIRHAAAVLGASPVRIWREVDLAIASRATAVGGAFAFAISLGEFGATSFVGRQPDRLTVPLAIERLVSQPGEVLRGQAMALSVILMVVTIAVVIVVDNTRIGRSGRLL